MPVATAVQCFPASDGFPRQVIRPRINDLRVVRIDGQRIHVAQFRITFRRDFLATFSRAVPRSGKRRCACRPRRYPVRLADCSTVPDNFS